jgi:hypothetical protein
MLPELTSGTIRTMSVEIEVAGKPVHVNINGTQATCWLPLTDDNQSSLSFAVNTETEKESITMNNVESMQAAQTVVTELSTKVKAVILEISVM